MKRYPLIIDVCLLVISLLIFYLSWIPSPDMNLLSFVPSFIGEWADKEGNLELRTAIPFIPAGILIGIWLLRGRLTLKRMFQGWLLLIAIAGIAELGQFFLESRRPDILDVLWAGAGAALGILLPQLLRLRRAA